MHDEVVWQTALPPALAARQPALAGLMQAASLTRALSALPAALSVQLRHLGAVPWQAHEAGVLALGSDTGLYGREVCLCLDGEAVVWARSVCADTEADWRALLDCGARPLGARLFDGSLPLSRTPFAYACAVWPDMPATDALWRRRSVFDWQGRRLLLGEAFLPALNRFLAAA